MSALARFAKLLGLPSHQAEDAMHSERAARAVLSRRSFFAASGALAAASAFSFAATPVHVWVEFSGGRYGMSAAAMIACAADACREFTKGALVSLLDDGTVAPTKYLALPVGRILRIAEPHEIRIS